MRKCAALALVAPALLIFASTPPHLLTLLQLREYELEREFPTERENKVRGEGSKYKYNTGGLDDEREVQAKYKYNVGLDDSRMRNEVVEFVPLVPEKKKQKSVHQPRDREHIVSNEIPLVSVTNRRVGLGKSSPSKGFRGSSSRRSKQLFSELSKQNQPLKTFVFQRLPCVHLTKGFPKEALQQSPP